LLKFIGPPLAGAFAELTGQPADSAIVSSSVQAYRVRYADVSLRETIVVPGIVPVLERLGPLHRLAVATSKPLVFAEPLLEAVGLRGYFEVCAGPELTASGEDKAVTIAAALRGLDSTRAIMVGDRSLDVVAARRCGLSSIAITWGIGSVQELRSADPDVIIDVPDQLLGVVEELAGPGAQAGGG
jgi:phosphoglycolate phosphatase